MSNLLSEAFSAVPSSVGLPAELQLIMEIQFSLLRSGVKRSHCVNCCYANHFQPFKWQNRRLRRDRQMEPCELLQFEARNSLLHFCWT